MIYIFSQLKLSGDGRRRTFGPLGWHSQAYPPLHPGPENTILGHHNHPLAMGLCNPIEFFNNSTLNILKIDHRIADLYRARLLPDP